MKTAGALLAIAICLLIAREARATTRGTGEPLVILTERGSKDAEDTAFLSSVRALAAEIGIVVSTEEVPTLQAVRDALLAEARSQRKPFLVAWILREGRLRRIHLFDPWNNQLRTRTIEAGTSATANAEALALILRAELLAYLHGPSAPPPPSSAPSSPTPTPVPSVPPAPPVSQPSPEASPPEVSPPSAPTPSSPTEPLPALPSVTPPSPSSPSSLAEDARWAVVASYVLGTFLRGQGMQQGGRLGIAHMGHHWRLALLYGLFPGKDAAGDDVVITVQRHPVDLEIGYATREYHRLRWGAVAVVSGDWVSRHTSVAAPPLTARPDAGHFLLGLGARGRQELRLFGNVAVVVALGVEAPLDPIEFRIARGTTTKTVTRLSPVRFSAELGIRVAVF